MLKDLTDRDLRDSTRQHAPTAIALDCHVIDTTALTISQVLEEAINVVRAKFLEQTLEKPAT